MGESSKPQDETWGAVNKVSSGALKGRMHERDKQNKKGLMARGVDAVRGEIDGASKCLGTVVSEQLLQVARVAPRERPDVQQERWEWSPSTQDIRWNDPNPKEPIESWQ